jgi:hypothetical protein
MTRIAIAAVAASLLLPLAAYGQQQPRETMPQQKDNHSQGTAPEGMGSTGWTGGTGGSHIGTSNSQTKGETTGSGSAASSSDPETAKNQPEMATGVDLKGPPTRFPANKTPE